MNADYWKNEYCYSDKKVNTCPGGRPGITTAKSTDPVNERCNLSGTTSGPGGVSSCATTGADGVVNPSACSKTDCDAATEFEWIGSATAGTCKLKNPEFVCKLGQPSSLNLTWNDPVCSRNATTEENNNKDFDDDCDGSTSILSPATTFKFFATLGTCPAIVNDFDNSDKCSDNSGSWDVAACTGGQLNSAHTACTAPGTFGHVCNGGSENATHDGCSAPGTFGHTCNGGSENATHDGCSAPGTFGHTCNGGSENATHDGCSAPGTFVASQCDDGSAPDGNGDCDDMSTPGPACTGGTLNSTNNGCAVVGTWDPVCTGGTLNSTNNGCAVVGTWDPDCAGGTLNSTNNGCAVVGTFKPEGCYVSGTLNLAFSKDGECAEFGGTIPTTGTNAGKCVIPENHGVDDAECAVIWGGLKPVTKPWTNGKCVLGIAAYP